MIPQISPEVYQTGFNYLTFGIPPIETISIACEFCHSKELVIQSRSSKKVEKELCVEIFGEFTFFCPYCYHIERIKIESICLRDITMKDIVEAFKEEKE